MFPVRFSGVQASRDDGPMRFESERSGLEKQMQAYYNPGVTNGELDKSYPP